MVYNNGQVVYSNSVNDMNMGQKIMVRMVARQQGKDASVADFSPLTPVQIASCSKWLSAALVMTFVDEGRIKLRDTIGSYLPALIKSGKGNITIAQCLSHTTGIKAPSLTESLQQMKKYQTMDDAVAGIVALEMEGKPGKVFRYSNVGLQLAGAVLEKITGKSFETLFQERIARPLGMVQTTFGAEKVALPAGGATSTATDYMNFLNMILAKGKFQGKELLSEASVAAMQVNRLTPDVKIAYSPGEAAGRNYGYGFGEWVMGATVSSPGLFGSYPIVDNAKGYSAILITFYLSSDGKQKRYAELKKLLDAYGT